LVNISTKLRGEQAVPPDFKLEVHHPPDSKEAFLLCTVIYGQATMGVAVEEKSGGRARSDA